MVDKKNQNELEAELTTAHHDHSRAMKSYAFFKVPNSDISEDLVQDTFIKTWRYLLKGGKIDVMRAFLYHILNHLIVDEYRKKKNVSLDVLMEQGFTPSVDPTERLLNVLDGKTAQSLIPKLPEKYQKVIKMRYVQDLSLKEMSLVTGQSKNTLAVQTHRGLAKLKKLYARL